MNLKKYFCGNETERMPSIAFSTMSFFFKLDEHRKQDKGTGFLQKWMRLII
jgi:hypothetical protein